jgi:hypothetical protein
MLRNDQILLIIIVVGGAIAAYVHKSIQTNNEIFACSMRLSDEIESHVEAWAESERAIVEEATEQCWVKEREKNAQEKAARKRYESLSPEGQQQQRETDRFYDGLMSDLRRATGSDDRSCSDTAQRQKDFLFDFDIRRTELFEGYFSKRVNKVCEENPDQQLELLLSNDDFAWIHMHPPSYENKNPVQ